jgi:hypothetical protein
MKIPELLYLKNWVLKMDPCLCFLKIHITGMDN